MLAANPGSAAVLPVHGAQRLPANGALRRQEKRTVPNLSRVATNARRGFVSASQAANSYGFRVCEFTPWMSRRRPAPPLASHSSGHGPRSLRSGNCGWRCSSRRRAPARSGPTTRPRLRMPLPGSLLDVVQRRLHRRRELVIHQARKRADQERRRGPDPRESGPARARRSSVDRLRLASGATSWTHPRDSSSGTTLWYVLGRPIPRRFNSAIKPACVNNGLGLVTWGDDVDTNNIELLALDQRRELRRGVTVVFRAGLALRGVGLLGRVRQGDAAPAVEQFDLTARDQPDSRRRRCSRPSLSTTRAAAWLARNRRSIRA